MKYNGLGKEKKIEEKEDKNKITEHFQTYRHGRIYTFCDQLGNTAPCFTHHTVRASHSSLVPFTFFPGKYCLSTHPANPEKSRYASFSENLYEKAHIRHPRPGSTWGFCAEKYVDAPRLFLVNFMILHQVLLYCFVTRSETRGFENTELGLGRCWCCVSRKPHRALPTGQSFPETLENTASTNFPIS